MPDTLKSICDQCTQLNNPQLDFLPIDFVREREIIRRDLLELIAATRNECCKTVVVLSGCVLETLLYSFVRSQESYIARRRGVFQFNPEHSLQNYVNIFNRWFRDVLPNAVISDAILQYRDLVHVNRELSSVPEICEVAAREMLRTLDAFLGELCTLPAVAKTQI